MAFKRFKRFGFGKTRKRSRYSRRRYYRRRSRPGRSVRRYRKFPRSSEAKVVSGNSGCNWVFAEDDTAPNNYTFYPMHTYHVFKGANDTSPGLIVAPGTGSNQRIGAKFTPIKLRFSGSISFQRAEYVSDVDYVPRAFAVRLIIYQVRGGNAGSHSNEAGYHPLALVANAEGMADATQVTKLIGFYSNNPLEPNIFGSERMIENIGAAKGPMRLGIGGQMRMLYQKTWTLQTGTRSSIPFRIVTKVPRRIVYPEVNDGGAGNAQVTGGTPRNCVYAAWIIVPQNVPAIGTVRLRYQCDAFFIDK